MVPLNGQVIRQRLALAFPGRCVTAFVELQGLDRSMVIASQAFTALVPLLILLSAVLPSTSRGGVSDVIVRKFGLEGEAARSVELMFDISRPGSVGVFSLLLLAFSGVSLTRRMQRMYLQVWRLPPLPGARGSLHAALGLAVMLVEIALLSALRTLSRLLPLDWVLGVPLSALAGVALWTIIPWLLLDRRISWRRLAPGGALVAVCATAYGFATTVYMPRLIAAYSHRYGLFGVTVAILGWLLCIAFIVVWASVVAAEFDRAPERWARSLRDRFGLHQSVDPRSGQDRAG